MPTTAGIPVPGTVLAFDVMGTLLNWHAGMSAQLASTAAAFCPDPHLTPDWNEVARHYRQHCLDRIRGRVEPAFDFDDVLRDALSETLLELRITLPASAHAEIIAAWDRLPFWPDVAAAFARLQQRYHLVAFSVLTRRALERLAERTGPVWHELLSCADFGVYKTHPDAYRRAAAALDVPPTAITMVACHDFDLSAAAAVGFNTARLWRPREWGSDQGYSPASQPPASFASLTELAPD